MVVVFLSDGSSIHSLQHRLLTVFAPVWRRLSFNFSWSLLEAVVSFASLNNALISNFTSPLAGMVLGRNLFLRKFKMHNHITVEYKYKSGLMYYTDFSGRIGVVYISHRTRRVMKKLFFEKASVNHIYFLKKSFQTSIKENFLYKRFLREKLFYKTWNCSITNKTDWSLLEVTKPVENIIEVKYSKP